MAEQYDLAGATSEYDIWARRTGVAVGRGGRVRRPGVTIRVWRPGVVTGRGGPA